MEYATCLWNHCDSSSGKNLTLGRTYLSTFRHIGSNIIAPSTDRTRPAPRDSHTEYERVLRPANLGSDCCLYLISSQPKRSSYGLKEQA